MRTCLIVVLALGVLAVPVHGAGTSVVYGKTIRLQVPGATAAYSLDPLYAEASAADGIVTISGKNPGEAKVIVVTLVGTETLAVTILQPPPSYPPGFVPPLQASVIGESGSYEFRYSSDPSQWQNVLHFVRRLGERRVEFHLANANALTPTSGSRISFPSLSYLISTRRREIVFLDQTVDNSVLTVDGATIRGFHYRQSGWRLHAGFASHTSFQDLLLSTDREGVIGLSRGFRVTRHSELTANLYAFRMSAVSSGRSGEVASLVYQYRPSETLDYSLEAGFSRGLGLAGKLHYTTGANQLRARFRIQPDRFAGLGLSNVRGQDGSVDWARSFSPKLSTNFVAMFDRYNIESSRHASFNSSFLVRYQIWPRLSVNGGVAGSSFYATGPLGSRLRSLNVPVGADFSTPHLGAGVQYQFSSSSVRDLGGRQVRANARAGWGPLQVSGFVDRQTHTPTVQADVPLGSPLYDSLARESVLATAPGAVSAALRDNARLVGLGYVQSTRLNVALQRVQVGGSVNWTRPGSRREQFSYNFLRSSDRYADHTLQYSSHAVVYSRAITGSNDLGFSFSLYELNLSGGNSMLRMRYELDFRHRFSTVPSFFAPASHGAISGFVFRDDAGDGEFRPGMTPLADVEVALDGDRRARTNERGFYRFDHLTAGPHRVEVLPKLDQPYFFTTSSSTTAEISSAVNFGIAFSTSQVFGALRNDAGEPVAGVTVVLERNGQQFTGRTGDDGKFSITGLPEGEYSAGLEVDSIPPGYWLQGIKKKEVVARPGMPGSVEFSLKANRALSGKVLAYDRRKGREVPVGGVTVKLREIRCQVTTNRDGAYRFKDMPAGTYTVVVEYHGRQLIAPATIPGSPGMVRDVNVNVGAR